MKYYIRKITSFILTLLFVAILSFLMFRIIPGDAAVAKLGTNATPETVAALRAQYGLDKSIGERFFEWLPAVLKGDFGMSMRYSTRSVASLIGERLPVTITLAIMSLLIITVFSLPLGLICARHPGGKVDRISDGIAVVFMAVPSFVTGILVTLLFGIALKMFTPGGYVSPKESFGGFIGFLVFPAVSVALPKIAMTVRFMKTSVMDELKCDYVRTARAKGNTESGVLRKHVFKNSLMPVITFIGLIVAEILAGSIMIEQVFNIPGMGRLLVTSIANRDFNVVQAIVLYIAFTVLLVNLLVDILYRLVDPRVSEV